VVRQAHERPTAPRRRDLTEETESPTERKRALRSTLIAERARLSPVERADRSRLIAERAARLPLVEEASVVALYAPLGTEVDALELARLLGPVRTVYPRAVPGSRRLEFARCAPRDLVRGALGAREPPASAAAVDLDSIACVVMPGIGFSAAGYRLGRGGGYYDSTVRDMPGARRVALAFDLQLLDEIPVESHDIRMDAIVTELRTLTFPGAAISPGGR
jgi:5-formyltetrahydrofolate cyclo-ligase